jgi:hypothetical protein
VKRLDMASGCRPDAMSVCVLLELRPFGSSVTLSGRASRVQKRKVLHSSRRDRLP